MKITFPIQVIYKVDPLPSIHTEHINVINPHTENNT